jgi:hypothetical protein
VSTDPLIGDVRLTYVYPSYTGLPRRVVEGSTGDIVGLKGTQVLLETRALHSARQALLLLGDAGDGGELPVKVADGRLQSSILLRDTPATACGCPRSSAGRCARRAPTASWSRRTGPPRSRSSAPRIGLELPTPRPIEIAYSARTDFGLGPIDLVYRVDDGPEQRQPCARGSRGATVQGKTVFEPSA